MNKLIGKDIRVCEFMACSKKLSIAKSFGANEVCFKINVPRGCWNGTSIKSSYLNKEEEVLIPPYSIFTVKFFARNHYLEDGSITKYFLELDLCFDNLAKSYFNNNIPLAGKATQGMD